MVEMKSHEKYKSIYCCGCNGNVMAKLTDGTEIYPHRPDLHSLPFWKCYDCKNFVGCHHKTQDRTRPLGCIPTKEIKNARKHIHSILDPIWQTGKMSRGKLYAILTEKLGREYHTAELKTIQEARDIYKAIKGIAA
jgi:hypothetical protein